MSVWPPVGCIAGPQQTRCAIAAVQRFGCGASASGEPRLLRELHTGCTGTDAMSRLRLQPRAEMQERPRGPQAACYASPVDEPGPSDLVPAPPEDSETLLAILSGIQRKGAWEPAD